MNKKFLLSAAGWGFLLWLIGYLLGIVFFMFVPKNLLGWFIMPIGIIITLCVLIKKIKRTKLSDYFIIAIVWTLIAILFDYIFIVRLFKSTGYYQLDVYVYYILTFVLPLIVGLKK
jgi:hypothetical protein